MSINTNDNQNSSAEIVKEHNRSHLADYFKEIIYGGIDGVITTFAVVAGFSGAALSNETTTQLSFLVVLLFGLANLFADGVSMGLGNFLSVRSDKDLYNATRVKEQLEIRNKPENEYLETVIIMKDKGFSVEQAETLANIYRTNEDYWVDFMMNNEHGMPDVREEKAALSGFTTFSSFLVFGSVPLLPFIFLQDISSSEMFKYSIIGTFLALVALGLMKWKIVGTQLWKSLIEVILVGGVAAFIAFYVGSLFVL